MRLATNRLMAVPVILITAGWLASPALASEPVRTFVDVQGDVEPAMVEEIEKRIQERDESFSLSEDREDADVVVSLNRQWTEEQEEQAYLRQSPATGAKAGLFVRIVETPEVVEVVYVEAEIRIGDGPPAIVKAGGSTHAKDVARDLVKMLEFQCKEKGLLSR